MYMYNISKLLILWKQTREGFEVNTCVKSFNQISFLQQVGDSAEFGDTYSSRGGRIGGPCAVSIEALIFAYLNINPVFLIQNFYQVFALHVLSGLDNY